MKPYHVAFAVLALAGCGGGERRTVAAPVTSPNAAALGCPEGDLYSIADPPTTRDPVKAARQLLEDELQLLDRVERIDATTVRVVRAGTVVAVVHFVNGRIDRLDTCRSFSG